MSNLTISIPSEIKKQLDLYPEINWTGYLKKSLISKLDLIKKYSKLENELNSEQEIIDWSVKLQRTSRKNRFEMLKKKGLI